MGGGQVRGAPKNRKRQANLILAVLHFQICSPSGFSYSACLPCSYRIGIVNDYLLSGFLGIIEGITEFLPISSTAHLRIAESLLHVDLGSGYWKMYTIVIQLGAILCLPVYFRERILKFLSTFPGRRHPLVLVGIAFVMTAVPSFFLSKLIGKNLESLRVMGLALLIGGIVMWIVDRVAQVRIDRMEDMTYAQAVWIGACQILSAVFPGTSRSMSTIAAGQLAGMSRASALEFSFFLSIPTMAAATGYDLLKAVLGKGENPIGVSGIDSHGWVVLAIGFVVSFFVAYASVAWFMAWVRQRGFTPFAIYRIFIGAVILFYVVRLP
jgi:undecaprenyl-diphosphatase